MSTEPREKRQRKPTEKVLERQLEAIVSSEVQSKKARVELQEDSQEQREGEGEEEGEEGKEGEEGEEGREGREGREGEKGREGREGEKGGERRKGDGREEAGKSKQRENEETMEEVVISPPDGPARKKPSSQFSGGASGAVGLTRTPITENASSTTISKVLLGGDDKARQGLPKSFLPPQSELYRPQGAESSVWAVCRKHEKYPNAALCLQCGKWLSHMTSTTSNLKNHIDSCKGTYSSYPDCRPINRGASAGASARSIKDSFQSAVDVAPQSRQKRREEKLVRW